MTMPTVHLLPASNLSHLSGRHLLRLATAHTRLFHALFDPYRPERYYMRGPGPRWYAKHGSDPSGTGED